MNKITSIHRGIDSPTTLIGRVYLILADAVDWLDVDEIQDASLHRWERRDQPEDIEGAIEELIDMGYAIDAQEMPGVAVSEYRMSMGDSAA